MNIDLTRYVISGASWGGWLEDRHAFTAQELRLSTGDGVTLAGPLRVLVSIQARNHFNVVGASEVAVQVRDVYGYLLEIPPGRTWTYPAPQALGSPTLLTSAASRPVGPALEASGAPAADPAHARSVAASIFDRELLWGANAGFTIVIRPTGSEQCVDPCAPDPCRPVDPCAPKKKDCGCGGRCGGGCGCGCHGEHGGDDLPCDFATGRGSSLGDFFPAACEPCTPGACVATPPVKGPALLVPAARGGTVRTRYFDGMFITKEDLWTDQNNNRIKHALMNRAMGQGVVWGLGVCLDGPTVCVLPGYGVDCCGNDIVISTPYRVDAQALVRDPAAARLVGKRGRQRLHLLLEYFECPEQPRPVHGDPCAPESTSCEMSRIRETARLRLVPPCDVDDAGPIRDFLDEVRRLKGDSVTGPILTSAPTPPAITAALAPEVPFTVTVEGLDQQGVVGALTLQPHLDTETPSTASGDVVGTGQRTFMQRARITVSSKPGFTLAAGDVVRQVQPGPIVPPPVRAATSISWEDVIPEPWNSKLVYLFSGWKYQAAGGSLTSLGTTITLTKRTPVTHVRMRLEVEVGPSHVEVPPVVEPPRFPCSTEACDPEGRPRFPVPLPWLHPHPSRPNEAADPRVILLAILYALVVARGPASGPPSSPEVVAEMERLTAALNLTAWKLFYDDVPDARRADLTEALRRLLQAWCKGLLYPGPRCECGCDPHGVVVGCAVVDGGVLRAVDPWGGRRWVVHYPLLAYWGKQFGLQPFDAMLSKFFDLLCCVAHLPPAGPGTILRTDETGALPGTPGIRTPTVPLGASALVVERPADLPARLAEMGVTVERTVELSPGAFVARVVEAMNAPASMAAAGARLVLHRVTGLPELNLVTPAEEALPSPTGGSRPPAAPGGDAAPPPSTPAPGSTPPAPERLHEIVRAAMSARPARSAIPPLLRDATKAMVLDLLDRAPLEPTTEVGRWALEAASHSGVATVARLLDADPEELYARVLNRVNATGLADLLEASEKTATLVAKAVSDTVVKFAGERRLVAREDLRDRELAGAFAEALGAALKGTFTPEAITAAISRAASPER